MNPPIPVRAAFWMLFILGSIIVACKNEPTSPATPQAQIVRITQTQYLPDERYKSSSPNPPILYKGKNYYYVIRIEKLFEYDSTGRLTVDKQTDVDFPNGVERGNGSNQYSYTGNIVIRRSSLLGRPNNTVDTLLINQWGYAIASYYLRSNTTYTYDENGYLLGKETPAVTTVRTIDGGNVINEVINQPASRQTIRYEYDRNQPNLVNPRSLFDEGKGNRNLLTKTTAFTEPVKSPYVDYPGQPYTVTTSNSYEFDAQQRVKQQLSLEENTLDDVLPVLTVKTVTYSN